MRGFGVRIYPKGEKSFVFSYRHEGRKRLISLGRVGELTLEQARDRALMHKVGLRNEGADPLAERQRALLGETVTELCATYLERHAKLRKRSWRDDEQRINKYIVPAWGLLKAAASKRMDVAALHRRVGAVHPYAANGIVELVSKMYELAKLWGILDEDHPNPGRRIEAFHEVKRERWVTAQEMPRLGAALQAEPSVERPGINEQHAAGEEDEPQPQKAFQWQEPKPCSASVLPSSLSTFGRLTRVTRLYVTAFASETKVMNFFKSSR